MSISVAACKYRLLGHAARAALLPLALGFSAGVAHAAPAAPALEEGARETGQIAGIVANASGLYVAGAEVRVDGSDVVEVTDSGGRFLIRDVAPGLRHVTVTYFGSAPQTTDVAVQTGETASISVTLHPAEGEGSGGILVSGSRPISESEAAAIQLKRASVSLVDVIAADSIGRFPDQNVAAALGRLPGVGVQSDQGQERYVSLRGAPNNWTTLAFDGINVISPEGRQARFDTIPSSLAAKIIVKKAVTPDMPGETVAGNIDIITRNAFDYPGSKIALDGAYGYNDLGGRGQYNIGGYASTRFAHDTLGILISGSHYERDMVTDNFENDWVKASQDKEPGNENRIWNSKTQNKLYRLTRTNTSASAQLDWRPSDSTRMYLNSIFTEFTDHELRNAWVFDLDQDAVNTNDASSPATKSRTGYADVRTGNTPLKGVLHGTEIESTENSNVSRQRIFTNTLGGDHDIAGWHADWRLNFTRAEDSSEPHFLSSWKSPKDFTQRPTLAYDFTDPNLSKVRLYQTIKNPDGTFSTGPERPAISPTELDFTGMTREKALDRTDAYTAKFDFDRHVSLFGADTLIRFGGEYDHRTKTSDLTVQEVLPADLTAANIPLPRQADFAIDDPFKGKIPLGYAFKYFSDAKGTALLDSYIKANAFHIQPDTSEQNNYKVTEQIFAGYLMGTTSFDWGNIVYGARIEHIENTGDALSQLGDSYVPTHVKASDTSVYPSLHINWNVNPDMKLRLSFNTGAARPDYDQLRPNFSFDDAEQVVVGGNPFAKPERAKGVDLYYEWYMPSRGYLSVGAYYKDLSDILFEVELPEFGLDVLNGASVDRSKYKFQTIANGGKGSIKGIELAYTQPLEAFAQHMGLPDWMAGFGFQTNATFNRSEATAPDGRKVDLPGASDFLLNASGYYERYGFSARVSWEYRSKWLDALGDAEVGDYYWGKTGRLSVSLRYSINPHAQIYFDANNLNDEPGTRFVRSPSRPIEHETFGARYLGGIRLNF